MKIAIFGGSFDPPHKGHIAIVKRALEELDIDYVIIVPTYLNPFKTSFQASPSLRLRWLRKIFLPYNRVKICDYEVRKGRPTYAIETVEFLRRKYAPKKLYYIIGSDNLPTLHKWHKYQKLSHLVQFVVATRKGYKVPKKYKMIEVHEDISSTELRIHPKKRYLPPIVAEEIIRFYRS
ncbi:nicotinate (nicotinamide) nucleotide adenylyltransferase [Nitratiruptor sp. SB155-2]|uniref:Probable nicotinate-nucleotide adenylyltransferase n=1 Tax=Nitratiruptor sp. (strain SB155-2) TaxID=387092 RepID=NADD_NITSB|nr:nicotinate (nicotinamide) nucleotide adenylyltransferase [Nitratiruptor sp. SB155-2]A6Q541.1 RecName: Full=Probable nicotinate-nucleotide adenylyltransferase; AltName: Full=Deamido-NAD(+) diphosphorylase; AltName: Full=Deamido-NAD(+) pyrophosphorylase; AltName: Full=Nicotinate mononucleotide adenylyltransferase; Short=NaMN adenylyltransferase [Nitratiruptor sp. SB155-2]BAF70600.1 nicotinate-nucleotide adenylyltransferase [Nitratiruptor sp. SB155-2]